MKYEQASLSPNTLRSYKSMWKKFESWCITNHLASLPASAETISLYLATLGEHVRFSTLDSTIAAIEAVHEKANQVIKGDPALFRRVRKGIRRLHKNNQSIRQAPALTVLELKGVTCKLSTNLKDCRDKAVLTVAFFGALRRSEVASLDVEHIELTDKGATIHIMQSKTSDTKQSIYLSYAKDFDICPVRSLINWLSKSQLKNGAVFRSLIKGERLGNRISGHSISNIIKRYFGKNYSGHSARRGLVTASAEKGTPMHVIQKHSRHKSANMVLRYIDETQGFSTSSVNVLGV